MFQAVWNGAVLAESDKTVKVEGNHYFPSRSGLEEPVPASAWRATCRNRRRKRSRRISLGVGA